MEGTYGTCIANVRDNNFNHGFLNTSSNFMGSEHFQLDTENYFRIIKLVEGE